MARWMKAAAGLALVAALVAAPVRAGEVAAASGPAVVTVTGNIANHNRGPFDAFADGFFKYQEKTFERALELDRAALARLDQVEIGADAEPWAGPVRLRGPLLAEVLALAGAEDKAVTLYALDGYGVRLEPEDLAAHRWVLAIEADGRPLGIGGRGPAWLAYEVAAPKRASTEEEGKWVWSVFHIAVE